MLDTSILIYLLKNRPTGIADRIDTLRAEDLPCMSFGAPVAAALSAALYR